MVNLIGRCILIKVCLYDNNELTEVNDEKFLNTIEELLLQDLMQ